MRTGHGSLILIKDMERFELRPNGQNEYRLIDNSVHLTVKFREHDFNGSQQIEVGADTPLDAATLAKAMREAGDWLIKNHSNIL